MDIKQAIERSHVAWEAFVLGDPEPAKEIFSHSADAIIANPWGATEMGWDQVSKAFDEAAAGFRDGSKRGIDLVAMYETPDLVTTFEIERWQAKVAGRDEVAPFDLRVSTTWRREDGEWKIVHRHADPARAPEAGSLFHKS
jgi:ketosteroid isomerase-like protein